MKKRLTPNQIWTLCLRMWRWIAKVWQTPRYKRYDVPDLKEIWLRKNGFHTESTASCFFCDYTYTNEDDPTCFSCPGVLVDSGFRCWLLPYDYETRPVEFYQELLRLNKIRKVKK